MIWEILTRVEPNRGLDSRQIVSKAIRRLACTRLIPCRLFKKTEYSSNYLYFYKPLNSKF